MNLDWESEVAAGLVLCIIRLLQSLPHQDLLKKSLSIFCLVSSGPVEKLVLSPMLMPMGRAGAAVFFTQGVSNWSTALREEGLGFIFLLIHLQGYDTPPEISRETTRSARPYGIWR